MDFDYYFKKYDEEYGFSDSELCGFEIGFEAGQKSKQEEVKNSKWRLMRLRRNLRNWKIIFSLIMIMIGTMTNIAIGVDIMWQWERSLQ